jgi:hypothetical protein
MSWGVATTTGELARARAVSGPLQACMGGWCAKRDWCAHYHAEDRRAPAERLCRPGQDGSGLAQPIVINRPLLGREESHGAA